MTSYWPFGALSKWIHERQQEAQAREAREARQLQLREQRRVERERKVRAQSLARAGRRKRLDKLSGSRFEDLVARLWEARGYEVYRLTSTLGPDEGIDLVAAKRG